MLCYLFAIIHNKIDNITYMAYNIDIYKPRKRAEISIIFATYFSLVTGKKANLFPSFVIS